MPLRIATPIDDEDAAAVIPPGVPDPSLQGILRAAWPLIIINLSITGMQFADAVMVAPVGEAALAAIFPAAMAFLVPVVFGHGMLAVANSFVAQAIGAGRPRDAGRYAVQGLLLGVALGLILQPLRWVSPAYFNALGHDPDVRALEIAYFNALLPSAAPSLVVVAVSAFFTGLLRPRILVVASIAATGLNILLNWLLIGGNAGFPALGVAGAGLATTLATVFQAAILVLWFLRPRLRATHGTGDWRPDRAATADLLRVGAPSGCLPVFDLLTWGVLIGWMVGLFGTAHLAANTIVVRYLHLAFMPAFALGAVLTAVVGQAIGGGRPEIAEKAARNTAKGLALYMAAIGLLCFAFRDPLVRVFTDDPDVLAAAGGIFACAAAYQVFDAMWLSYSHALRGAGDTVWPAAAVLVLGSTVLVGGAWTLVSLYPGLGSLGPWIATAIHTALLGLSMAWRWHAGGWKKRTLLRPATT